MREEFARTTPAQSRAHLMTALADLGEFADALGHGNEAVRLAEALDRPFDLFFALLGRGNALVIKGEFREAVVDLERGWDLCRAGSYTLHVPWAAMALGSAYLGAGRMPEAVAIHEVGVAQSTSLHGSVSHAFWLTGLARAYLESGRMAEASARAREAETIASTRGERRWEVHVRLLLGDIAARQDPPDVEAAQASYAQAIALTEQCEMRPRLAICRFSRALLYERIGGRDDARAELSAALELFRAMAMDSWAARAELTLDRWTEAAD